MSLGIHLPELPKDNCAFCLDLTSSFLLFTSETGLNFEGVFQTIAFRASFDPNCSFWRLHA